MSLRTTKVGLLKSGIKSLNGGLRHTRNFSQSTTFVNIGNENFPRRQHDLFEPHEKYPFPGAIGSKELSQLTAQKKAAPLNPKRSIQQKATTSEGFRRIGLEELPKILNEMRIRAAPKEYYPEAPVHHEAVKVDRELELKAVPCPKTLKTDLRNLFVGAEFDVNKVTVLNLTQKSQHDMSAWSPEMETEREELNKNFIEMAQAICKDLVKLNNGRYWADFIDPSSGRPYYGSFTNMCLFETDEHYSKMGFQIEDLGCCKVIKHSKWLTHSFVGTIFTDAPLESEAMKKVLASGQAGQYFQEKDKEIPSHDTRED